MRLPGVRRSAQRSQARQGVPSAQTIAAGGPTAFEPLADLFDEGYYVSEVAKRLGTRVPADLAWQHYVRVGDAAGISPSPYVDLKYVRGHYGPAAADAPALAVVVQELLRGHDPRTHPLIDPDFYRTQVAGLPEADSALLHFIRHGDAENRRPSLLFDPIFYRSAYLSLLATRPFRHYAEVGRPSGLLPRPQAAEPGQTREALRQVMTASSVILIGHDMQDAGGPLTVAMIARELIAQGRDPIFVTLTGGALYGDFTQLGPVFLLSQGWNAQELWTAIPADTPIIANTAVSSALAADVAASGHRVLNLIHEYPDYIEKYGCTEACVDAARAGVTFGFVLDVVRDSFAEMLRDRGVPGDKVDLRTLGFAPYEARPNEQAYADARTSLEPLRPLVVGAGFADERKGFDLFLTVAAHLDRDAPHVRVGWFGEIGPWAQQQLDNATVADPTLHIERLGQVAHFQAWIAACDALVVTSRSDTGPGTVLYAFMEGVPVVAFDADLGAAEYIQEYGWLVEKFDTQAMANAVQLALTDRDPQRAERQRDAAKAFDSTDYVQRLLSIFDERERAQGAIPRTQ